jgi:hypothetical protein
MLLAAGEGIVGICREEAIAVGCERNLPSFLAIMRFPYKIVRFLLHNFRTRFRNEISYFLAMRCPNEICRGLLHTFLMRFRAFLPCEIST